MKKLKHPDSATFDEAQELVLNLMEKDSFRRFLSRTSLENAEKCKYRQTQQNQNSHHKQSGLYNLARAVSKWKMTNRSEKAWLQNLTNSNFHFRKLVNFFFFMIVKVKFIFLWNQLFYSLSLQKIFSLMPIESKTWMLLLLWFIYYVDFRFIVQFRIVSCVLYSNDQYKHSVCASVQKQIICTNLQLFSFTIDLIRGRP